MFKIIKEKLVPNAYLHFIIIEAIFTKSQVKLHFIITGHLVDNANFPQPWVHVMDIDGDVSPLIVDVITDVSLNFFLRVCALKVNSGLPCL